ncbi:MAG: UDP-3-O-(3-hydroxymyristoyl)glucosamine N-acyltransferase [Gammaproteobacteria bacterium]
MQLTLSQIQQQTGGELHGSGQVEIQGVNSLDLARPGDLAFAESSKFLDQARQSKASALIVPKDFPVQEAMNCLRVDRPRQVFIGIMMLFDQGGPKITGVHPSAIVGGHSVLAEGVAVGENAVIRDCVKIGEGTCIEAGAFIGEGVIIGEHCHIGPNVTIRHDVSIGDRVVIHAGSVVGGEGFGYFWDGKQQKKVPQLGGVQIDDDVEIGCNVCIDRATFGVTRIRQGAKIDNLVQIAHNNDIGAHSIIVSQVGLSGSVTLGERVTLAGQVGVADHITIGAGATAAARTGISKDIKPGEVSWGAPNRPIKQVMREMASIARLPKLMEQVKQLTQRLKALEARIDKL